MCVERGRTLLGVGLGKGLGQELEGEVSGESVQWVCMDRSRLGTESFGGMEV